MHPCALVSLTDTLKSQQLSRYLHLYLNIQNKLKPSGPPFNQIRLQAVNKIYRNWAPENNLTSSCDDD